MHPCKLILWDRPHGCRYLRPEKETGRRNGLVAGEIAFMTVSVVGMRAVLAENGRRSPQVISCVRVSPVCCVRGRSRWWCPVVCGELTFGDLSGNDLHG